MQAFEVLKAIIEQDGLSVTNVSERAHKPSTYISKTIWRGSNPNCTTMVELLDAMGYDLIARNRKTGKEFRITRPPDLIG